MSLIARALTAGVWEALAWCLWLYTLARVVRTPADRFVHGWWTKAGRLVVSFIGYRMVGGMFVPWGAALVLISLAFTTRRSSSLDLAPRRGPDLPE